MVAAMLMLMSVGSALALPTDEQLEPVDPIEGCTFFDVTGHNLCDEFEAFWNAQGGLPVFGYALTEAYDEVNPDTGETYLTQYLERQRFELHPENEGTVYNVLLGRLGAQMLEINERDWHSFPKADPSEDHYFAETGQAIAPEFWEYWSTHGLDYGDEGVSLRESVLLFGYPISQPEMETNPDGDTVLTQWFERARFEWHEGENGGFVLLGRLGAELTASEEPPPVEEPTVEVVAEGLSSPRGIATGADGALYFSDSGLPAEPGSEGCVMVGEGEEAGEYCFTTAGTVQTLVDGEQTTVATGLPGSISDIAVTETGELYVLTGLGADPAVLRDAAGELADGYGQLLAVDLETDTWTVVADVAGYETDANPDGGVVDSNPYALLLTDDGFLVVDAGMNAMLHVTMEGEISTVAVFPSRMVDPPPFLELPEGVQIPMESVPTSVVVGPDGAWYVSELTGFPFEVGAAQVWRVMDMNDDGDALDEGEMTVYADGFTNIVDLAFDADGHLYVLEVAKDGLLAAEDPENPSDFAGALIHVESEDTRSELAVEPLIAPTGLMIDADGSIYVANFGVMPTMGQILQITPVQQ
jgi:hypothetical protein